MARKSVTKRIRVTRTGKLMRRTMGQGHCRAKKTGVQLHRKRSSKKVHASDAKIIMGYLNAKN